MAEDQVGLRRDALREWAPWIKLFSAFKVALDPKKLILAAGGLLAVALGWWVLSALFWLLAGSKPEWTAPTEGDEEARVAAWKSFKRDRLRWNKLYEMAGPDDPKNRYKLDAADVADSQAEYEDLKKTQEDISARLPKESAEGIRREASGKGRERIVELALILQDPPIKPFGRMRTLPWFEDRGPNPYLLVTGNALSPVSGRNVPWERGQFFSWLLSDQLPVLIEPLVKFFRPVIYLFDSGIGPVNALYLVLVILWSLAVWAIFGGAITRMAAVQLTRPNEKVSLTDAVKFAYSRVKSYFSAPAIPLLFLLILTVVLWVFGTLEVYTFPVGDIVLAGLFWPIVLLVGLIMAVVVVGLVGWPLMYATISTEGSDSFDAISRSYSYVYQAPWQYLWYSFIALVYGAVVVFFIGLMGSLTVYLGKWAVYQAPHPDQREQSYLYMYTPTSFGWRDLLLADSPNTTPVQVIRPTGLVAVEYGLTPQYAETVNWHNKVGAGLVSFWITLVFLLIVGFGYSYFWTATTIIYLLMRRVVDDTEMDEVHLEEDDHDQPAYSPPSEPVTAKQAAPSGGVMVDAPTLRTPPPPAETPRAPNPDPLPLEKPPEPSGNGGPPAAPPGSEEKPL